MATTRQVLQSLCTLIQAGPSGGSPLPSGPNLQLAVGWPPEDAIMSVPKTQTAVAGVFDAGKAPMDKTRWHQIPAVPDTNVSPTTTATLGGSGSGFLTAGGTQTVTIGGTPQAADAIGVQAGNNAATYVVRQSDTLDSIATDLASAINSAGIAVTATASGAVVTLTATKTTIVALATSNVGTRTTEYHRVNRFVRIVLFTPFEDSSDGPNSREAIGDPIDLTLAQLESTFGFQTPNNEWVRVMYDDDLYVEQLQLKDIYRRDFMTRLEYGVTGVETVYPALGTNLSLQGGY